MKILSLLHASVLCCMKVFEFYKCINVRLRSLFWSRVSPVFLSSRVSGWHLLPAIRTKSIFKHRTRKNRDSIKWFLLTSSLWPTSTPLTTTTPAASSLLSSLSVSPSYLSSLRRDTYLCVAFDLCSIKTLP